MDESDFESPEGTDWGRFGIQHPNAYQKVGDPTRWGAKITQVPAFAPGSPLTQILQSSQIISAQCRDPYARQWSIVGTLKCDLWLFNNSNVAPGWTSILSVTMGVGQNQIIHNIDLRATVEADAPFYVDSFTSGGLRERAFIIPGALVANAISIQVINTVNYVLLPLPDGDPITTALQICPLAAGTGL